MKSKLTKISFYAAIVETVLLLMIIFGARIGNDLPADSFLLDIITVVLFLFLVLLPLGTILSAIALVYASRSKDKSEIWYSAIALGVFLLIVIFLFVFLKYFFRPFGGAFV
jgi:hypothetical protein